MSWEDRFTTWAQPPGPTEQEKCDNAERAVRRAIAASPAFRDRNVRVFPQGSYRNRTNVRADSDVDISVLCTNTFYYDLPAGMNEAAAEIQPASYDSESYRRDVSTALIAHFGATHVTPGSKAFDIHENTYRVDADVVACFEYRYYAQNGSHIKGTSLLPRGGGRIDNFPEQNYDNGVAKNDATGRRFKAIVRILKNLKNEMAEEGIEAAGAAPSYLLECLTWNVPNERFGHFTYATDVREVLAGIFNATLNGEDCKAWTEVNNIKYLFHESQPWTYQQAHGFADAAWDYLELR